MKDRKVSLNSKNSRLLERSCESLLGICMGLLADKKLNADEVQFLDLWLRENAAAAEFWPGSIVSQRVSEVLSDGVITEDELLHLKVVLSELLGGTVEDTGAVGGISTSLPIDRDCVVTTADRSFCFTGKFLYGTRTACESFAKSKGASVRAAVTKDLDYLVVGTLVSPDWICSAYGRKIEAAMENRLAGASVLVISEEQWIRELR